MNSYEEALARVANCAFLDVLEEPDLSADVIMALPEKTEVMIETAASTKDFYKIYTAAGMEGYCMRQFIAINRE